MYRIWLLVSAVMLATVLAGCHPAADAAPSPNPNPPPQAAASAAAVGR